MPSLDNQLSVKLRYEGFDVAVIAELAKEHRELLTARESHSRKPLYLLEDAEAIADKARCALPRQKGKMRNTNQLQR